MNSKSKWQQIAEQAAEKAAGRAEEAARKADQWAAEWAAALADYAAALAERANEAESIEERRSLAAEWTNEKAAERLPDRLLVDLVYIVETANRAADQALRAANEAELTERAERAAAVAVAASLQIGQIQEAARADHDRLFGPSARSAAELANMESKRAALAAGRAAAVADLAEKAAGRAADYLDRADLAAALAASYVDQALISQETADQVKEAAGKVEQAAGRAADYAKEAEQISQAANEERINAELAAAAVSHFRAEGLPEKAEWAAAAAERAAAAAVEKERAADQLLHYGSQAATEKAAEWAERAEGLISNEAAEQADRAVDQINLAIQALKAAGLFIAAELAEEAAEQADLNASEWAARAALAAMTIFS
jgi:hypothetical protein